MAEEQKANAADKDIEYIKSKIGTHKDFPKPGIVFRDIFPVLRDPKGFEMIINRLCNMYDITYYPNTLFMSVDILKSGIHRI